MQPRPLTIRSTGLRGYGAGILAAFAVPWSVISALVFHISDRPGALKVWTILVVALATVAVAIELVFRTDFVAVADGKLSWRMRPGGRGEQPLSSVRAIERTDNGSALIVFSAGEPLVVGSVWYRRSDIVELIQAIENASPSPLGN
jgi:hypothetical protein